MRPRRCTSLVLSVLVSSGGLAALAVAPSGAASQQATPKTLVVGMDGLNWSQVADANTPVLDGLAADGTLGESMLYCGDVAGSWSGPGWSTIATGVWPDKHGVQDNSFSGSRYAEYPDFLTRLEQADPSLNTYSAVTWTPLHDAGTFGPAIDTRVTYDGDTYGWPEADELVTSDTEDALATTDVDGAFVYLGNTDIVAHSVGTGSEYLDALETQDAQLGRLIDAVESRSSRPDEDWLVVVTTDHGHEIPGGGHGGCGAQSRSTFVLASGDAMDVGLRPLDTRLVDVASTVLDHFAVPADPAWGLDGKPLNVRSTDAFDNLTLQPSVDETGISSDVLGWTHDVPAGWSVDRSAMPSGGITEWRGWSFTNEQFWTRTDGGQNRENGLRLRGTFAVADSDEFADASGGSSFDSTLVSPSFPVTGGGTATVEYVTHYLQEGSQTADVLVSFDGGADQVVKQYTADARAAVEALEVAVPSDASSMVVKFHYYNASNNWYWAIDDLTVTDNGGGGGEPTPVQLKNPNSGRCLDIEGGGSDPGTATILWNCHGSANQLWTFTNDGEITGKDSVCLDVSGNSSADGTPVIVWTCHGGANHQWQAQPDGTITGLDGKCLSARDDGTANGTIIELRTCTGSPAQLWTSE